MLSIRRQRKRDYLSNISSMFSSLTPYILNPTHKFKDTNVKQYNKNNPKQDNKKEAKEIYVIISN